MKALVKEKIFCDKSREGIERARESIDWVFQTGCFAPGFTRNDWGTSRPCLFPPMAVKSKPPAVQVVVDAGGARSKLDSLIDFT